MKVRAIAPWFGGKRTMAPAIVTELGKHTQYFEPFCGSMAVLFSKDPSQKETVNDLHGDLINLARVLQDRESAEWLYDRLSRTLFSEDLLENARSKLGIETAFSIPLADRAYWYFLASWMSRNGTAGTARVDYQIAVRWTKGGGSPKGTTKTMSKNMPRAMVLVYQPELTHSVWIDWRSQHRTLSGLESRLRRGIRKGEWVSYRLIRVEKEVLGNVRSKKG